MRGWHLKNIVREHGLADETEGDVETLGTDELIERIVTATRPPEETAREEPS